MNKKREIYSDLLKILSIFLVIVIHSIAFYRDKYLFINQKYYFFLTFVDSFTRIAVPIFFMITGTFMLSKKEEKYSTYLKKRIPKLLIPFLLISIFYYAYECNKNGISLSIKDFIIAFFSNNIKYHFWYMYAIILIYIIIPFLQVLVQNLNRKKMYNLILILFILTNIFNTIFLLTDRYNFGILSSFTLPGFFSYINFLFLGYYLHKYDLDKKKKICLFIISLLCILIMPVADHFFIDGIRNDQMLVVTSVFPIIPSIFTYIFFKDLFKNKKISERLSSIITIISSCVIYIYMIHVYVIEKFEKDLSKHWICNSFLDDILRIFIVSIVTFLTSLVIAYLIVIIKKTTLKIIDKIKKK